MNAPRFAHMLSVFFFLAGVSFIPAKAHAQGEKPEYYPNGVYDQNIPPPESVLGFPVGERPARYEEAVRYLKTLAEKSPRVKLSEMGTTYESRKQYCLILTSEENQKRLEEIRLSIVRLAHPVKLNEASARGVIDATPAVAWIGYGIHGDELSSVDASLQLAYQLAAGTDSATLKILRELVVCVDPMENPDGRERFLSQIQQWAGQLLNSDGQSMAHGIWPYGRGNHYLFDMNRDWINLTQLENQARIQTIVRWNPQLLIDSHEMGSYDTYLFYPPRQPINPNVGDQIKKWWKIFSADQARAFDRYGWSYYTREWSDEWFPGYGSSWALYTDAVGILYEQAGTDGSLVKRPDGSSLTFREAVHHHFVSSIANLTTAANNRRGLLSDFWKAKVNGVAAGKGDPRTFYLVPGKNSTRVERLVEKLLMQDIEVKTLDRDFEAQDLHDYWGSKPVSKTLPAGTYSVSLEQPMGRLAKAIMEFDPRMLSSSLEEERKALEKEGYSKMYDVTAWSLPIAYGIEAYWSERRENQAATPVETLKPVSGGVQNPRPSYGFLFDYSDDRAVEALVMLFAKGYNVRCGKEPSEVEGRSFPRGTILLRLKENPKSLSDDVKAVAEAAGIIIYGVNTALSTRGSDLGGNDFVLLRKPQIALIAGPEISTTSLGSLWHLLDYRLKYRISVLNSQQVNYTDLTKYNVIVLPSGGSRSYNQLFGKAGIGKIREWVSAGGTLIGLEGAAAFLADTSSGLSDVRLRQQALKDLDLYSKAVELEKKAGMPKIDSISIWEGKQPPKDTSKAEKAPLAVNEKEIALQDERARLFMPRGAILWLELDAEHWLNYGAGDKVPAILFTSDAMLSKDPVQTAARFSDSQHLRISGLLWPEARERWAKTAYATRESKGKGQIILFAGEPCFRACFPATERLLLNSLFLGPGFGTEHPVDW